MYGNANRWSQNNAIKNISQNFQGFIFAMLMQYRNSILSHFQKHQSKAASIGRILNNLSRGGTAPGVRTEFTSDNQWITIP